MLSLTHLGDMKLYASITPICFAQNSMPHHLDMYVTKVQRSPSAIISVKPYPHSLTHMNVCTTHTTLPLQRNAAKKTQRSIVYECTSGVPKCKNTVGVIEAFDYQMAYEHTDSAMAQNSMQHHLDMCATEVQHSPSATISVKSSTHTV
jgi:hypothetical protein